MVRDFSSITNLLVRYSSRRLALHSKILGFKPDVFKGFFDGELTDDDVVGPRGGVLLSPFFSGDGGNEMMVGNAESKKCGWGVDGWDVDLASAVH